MDVIIFEKWLPDQSRRSWGESIELWSVKDDGSVLRRLTTGFHDTDPAWSPDRNRIAFDRAGSGIWILDLRDGSLRQVVEAKRLLNPQWLSEKELIYSILPDFPPSGGSWRFFIYSFENDASYMLPVGDLSNLSSALVSPNKKWIAFRGSRGNSVSVYLAEVDGIANSFRLIIAGNEYPLFWLPDSSGFTVQEGRVFTVINIDGSSRPLLPRLNDLSASWSPDGSAFVIEDKRFRLWRVSKDGKERRLIAEPGEDGQFSHPVWLH